MNSEPVPTLRTMKDNANIKVVYIAGKFRGPNYWEQERNIRLAEELALLVWKAGMAALCPHTNTRYFQGAAPDHVFLDGDLELLRRCDALLTVHNWLGSKGAVEEVGLAHRLGIPVFHEIGELLYWNTKPLKVIK